uniref:Uncharacterized protein n=1 Tax=Panagrolaimus sp. JU765 TaxID=591449 RepID=A0AC34PVG0_9BILA
MFRKIELLPIILILIAIAFFAQTQATSTNRDAIIRTALMRQLLDRYSPYYDHVVARRFDLNFPYDEDPRMEKRNNAEVVNHILKNFGGIGHLGDVGK